MTPQTKLLKAKIFNRLIKRIQPEKPVDTIDIMKEVNRRTLAART